MDRTKAHPFKEEFARLGDDAANQKLLTDLSFGEQCHRYYCDYIGLDFSVFGDWQRQYAAMVKDACKPTGRMLDIGCAMGSTTVALAQAGIDVVGVDVNRYFIEKSPWYNSDLKGRLYSNAMWDLQDIADGSIGFIHSHQVLEHLSVQHADRFFQEIHRVTGGKFGLFSVLDICETEDSVTSHQVDVTHLCLKPQKFWQDYFRKYNIKDTEAEVRPRLATHSIFRMYNWGILSGSCAEKWQPKKVAVSSPIKQDAAVALSKLSVKGKSKFF